MPHPRYIQVGDTDGKQFAHGSEVTWRREGLISGAQGTHMINTPSLISSATLPAPSPLGSSYTGLADLASGRWRLLFPLPGRETLFQVATWPVPSLPSSLGSNVTLSARVP